MSTVTYAQALASITTLLESINAGEESEIIVTKQGIPIAKLVPIKSEATNKRIGIAKGLFVVPDDIDSDNAEIAATFLGDGR
ncbi:type II toxin-antitoxin system Phd/YefM family antitoxin [Roseateles koreensis]|uniref:Prevent-host-death protein n=1 Tax=Roseateles koreensis TaxID=2987526 RepID=A0ABT5KV97_9BURK|nr:prevent-host-death protein [Roseateles koreensis]MDC8786370.1 prevent-host-death protein [Roseateles koreensis]